MPMEYDEETRKEYIKKQKEKDANKLSAQLRKKERGQRISELFSNKNHTIGIMSTAIFVLLAPAINNVVYPIIASFINGALTDLSNYLGVLFVGWAITYLSCLLPVLAYVKNNSRYLSHGMSVLLNTFFVSLIVYLIDMFVPNTLLTSMFTAILKNG